MSLGVCYLYIPKLLFSSFFIEQMICLVLNDLFSIKNKKSDYD